MKTPEQTAAEAEIAEIIESRFISRRGDYVLRGGPTALKNDIIAALRRQSTTEVAPEPADTRHSCAIDAEAGRMTPEQIAAELENWSQLVMSPVEAKLMAVAAAALRRPSPEAAQLREALEPFAAGAGDGVWGTWKAWMVAGAPTAVEGIQAARRITELQSAASDALMLFAAPDVPPTQETER